MNLKSKPAMSLDELTVWMQTPKINSVIEENIIKHFGVSPTKVLTDVSKWENRQHRKKSDYNLYSIYKSLKNIIDGCEPTTSELFPKNDAGQIELSEAASTLIGLSEANKEIIMEAFDLYKAIDGEAERLRDGFVKEKVLLNRYSRRGAEYAQLFNNIVDKALALATACISIQLLLADELKKCPEELA